MENVVTPLFPADEIARGDDSVSVSRCLNNESGDVRRRKKNQDSVCGFVFQFFAQPLKTAYGTIITVFQTTFIVTLLGRAVGLLANLNVDI